MLSHFGTAPGWAETTAPRNFLHRATPSLLLVKLPDEEGFVVATLEECDAIADPNSFLGRLLRQHCALLALPYVSDN